ncbi:MAG TPA: hypothetical protein VN922_11685 [Bacteroidia bacterium]|nr:hypothetical protein [Bacteroidia bacterium]
MIATSDSSKNRFASSWSMISGPSTPIFNEIGDSMWISALVPGSYKFQLTVQDSVGNTDSIATTVTVSPFICPSCPILSASTCLPYCPSCPVPRTVVSTTWNAVTGLTTVTYSDGTTTTFKTP